MSPSSSGSPRGRAPGLRRVPCAAPPASGGQGGRGGESRECGSVSHGPRGEGGRRREGLCRALTCLSVTVTRGGHRRESRAQPRRTPAGTRRRSPTHFSAPRHALPPGPQFPSPGALPQARTLGCPRHSSRHTLSHSCSLAQPHAWPTLPTPEEPAPAPRPTPRLHSRVSQPWGPGPRRSPPGPWHHSPRPPPRPQVSKPAPVSPVPALCRPRSPSPGTGPAVTPPPVPDGAIFLKCKSGFVDSLLHPCCGFLCPRAKACPAAPAPGTCGGSPLPLTTPALPHPLCAPQLLLETVCPPSAPRSCPARLPPALPALSTVL